MTTDTGPQALSATVEVAWVEPNKARATSEPQMDTKAEPDDSIENIAEEGEEEEELDDEEEDEDAEEELVEEPEVKPKGRRRRSILTGRGVTLSMLLDDGVIEPGEKCLSIAYLGQKFSADLMPDGRIKWPDAGKVFNSPSAWAIYCKRLVNPAKKSGCGWASVKYKGRKLDQYKSTWFRKQQPSDKVKKSPAQPSSGPSSSGAAVHSASVIKASASLSYTPKSIRTPGRPPNIGNLPGQPKGVGSASKSHSRGTPGHSLPLSSTSENRPLVSPRSSLSLPGQAAAHSTSMGYPYSQMSSAAHRSPTESALLPSMSSPPPSGEKQGSRSRLSVRYSSITPENDTKTLVELVSFSEIGRQAPFSVDISTNCLLLMDYHCHLTASEVVGYLAGKFDPQTHHMKILQAFPCRCRFADKGNAPKVEEEIQNAIIQRGLQVVGWYHSHPSYQPDPSIEDIRNQQKYQKTIGQWGAPYEPCVGIIISPYSKHKPSSESVFQAFWVLSPPEGQEDRLGMPMYLNITQQQDQFLSQDLLNELAISDCKVLSHHSCLFPQFKRWLWSFYKTCPDTINFNTTWFGNQSYLDKVKASLVKKFPTDQADGRFLEFINTLLT